MDGPLKWRDRQNGRSGENGPKMNDILKLDCGNLGIIERLEFWFTHIAF